MSTGIIVGMKNTRGQGRRICSMYDCTSFVTGLEYCEKHYNRFKKYGDPNFVLPREQRGRPRKINVGPCSVDDCETPSRSRGMCAMHYTRFRKHGDSSTVLNNPNMKTCPSTISYSLIHERVRNAKGSASNYRCRHCLKQAQDWAYNHLDPDERFSIHDPNKHHYSHTYSLNPDFYIPLCRKCHKALDGAFTQNYTP